jgi:hypothetical protein
MLSLKENPFPLILNQGSPASILQVLKLIDRVETSVGFKNLLRLVAANTESLGIVESWLWTWKHLPFSPLQNTGMLKWLLHKLFLIF